MSWKKERDALIAQTMAFVQSVTGNKAEAPREAPRRLESGTERLAARPEAGLVVPAPQADPEPRPFAVAAPPLRPAAFAAPIEPVKSFEPPPRAPLPRPIVQTDMKNEIQARIASFRVHQERFNRERAEYFSATLARLRAAIDEAPPPRKQVTLARGPVSRRSSPIPATAISEIHPPSRSSENGRGPS
jgi:hypothetical protein